MLPVQIRFTKKTIEKLDELVRAGMYSNRSQVIRDATRRHLEKFSEKGKH